MTEPRRVQANGLEFAVLERGSGPLVLCLHGYPDTARTWDELAPALVDAGYRVAAPYMRGYAPSQAAPDGDYSALSLGRDALALIDALGESSAIVIGHDWGALAAFVATNLAPEKVRKLVTIAIPHPGGILPTPRTLWGTRHFFYYALPWLPERSLPAANWSGIRGICARWSPDWAIPEDEFAELVRCFEAPGTLQAALGYYRSFVRGLLGRDFRTTAALLRRKTTVPSLAVAGGADPALYIGDFEGARRGYAGEYRVVEVPGCGHFVHRERPEATAQAILEFLGPAAP